MVVQHSRPLIEPACVPRIVKLELLIIEMMAKLVAKRAEECAKGGHLLTHGGSSPDAN